MLLTDILNNLKKYIDTSILNNRNAFKDLFEKYKTKLVAENINEIKTNADNINDIIVNSNNINDILTTASHIANIVITSEHINNVDTYALTYLGPKSSDPSKRNDDSNLVVGDLYYDTQHLSIKVYDGAKWVNINNLQNGGSVGGDIYFPYETTGIILADRNDTSKKYRFLIEDGNIKVEEV